jgi:hypothetical protein
MSFSSPTPPNEGGLFNLPCCAALLCLTVHQSLHNRFTEHAVLPLLLNGGGDIVLNVVFGG